MPSNAMSAGGKMAAQGMGIGNAKATIVGMYDSQVAAAFNSSYTNTTGKTLTVVLAAWGCGSTNSGTAQGGSGANAGLKRFKLAPGQTFSWTSSDTVVGGSNLDGQDTVVILPDGTRLSAAGGRFGGTAGENSGPWDISRKGGRGRTGAVAGESSPDPGGGTPSNFSGSFGGAGATAGFTDIVVLGWTPGQPYTANAGAQTGFPPGGSMSGTSVAGSGRGWAGTVRFALIDEG